MADLSTKTIAIIATDGFEDSELTSPADAVREAGATVKVIAPEAGTISGKKGASIDVDATTADVRGEKFDGNRAPWWHG